MKKRRTFTPEEKTKMVLEVLKEEATLSEIASKYELQPNLLTRWKTEFLANASRAFNAKDTKITKLQQSHEQEKDELLRQIGQLSYEVNWLKKNLNNLVSRPTKTHLVDKNNKQLTIKRQCELLELNRTSIYYTPRPKDQSEEYRIKWLIDEIYTAHPEYGYRRITVVLNQEYSIKINRKRTQKYMREMGIQGIHPGPNLSKQGKAKYIHPYLLRNLTINTPNHVWSIDITYIRLKKGFLYMAAIIDWHSRLLLHYEV